MTRQMSTATFALIVAAMPLFADDVPRTFQGNWVNRKTRASGTMKCVATAESDGQWKATFSGVFMGRPFTYDVDFRARPAQGQTALAGTARIQNHNYEWAGALKGGMLTGRYRADNGWFGEFVLKEMK